MIDVNTSPFVTIVLPIRNEGDYITATINAILAQNYPRERFEILVADGMSTDNTRGIIKNLQLIDDRLQMIDNPGMIVPKGLNIAIRKALGDVIIRIDGHTLIQPDYVSKCIEVLLRTNADNCGGCMTAVGITKFGQAVALATSTPFGVGNSKFHYSQKEEDVDSVYMGTWPKKIFEQIGLFDEELVRDQDDEFNYRLKKAGGRIILNPEIKSQYITRSNPKQLFKQYFQYGFWKVRVFQKHPSQLSLRQFVPPLFILSLLGSILLTLFVWCGWFILVAVVCSYLLANIIASLITSSKKGWQHFCLLPFVFATIHISYGCGFITGLFKFWKGWGDKTGKVPTLNQIH